MKSRRIILLGLRLVTGGLFVYSGAIKAWDPASFAGSIDNFDLVPYPLAVAGALVLPYLEIVCGVALVGGVLGQGALALLLAMMVAFTGAMAWAWIRGLDVNCGCFGAAAGKTDYALALLRNAGLVGALIILSLAWGATRPAPEAGTGQSRTPGPQDGRRTPPSAPPAGPSSR